MPPILNAQGVSKRFGAVPLFDQISFVISDGDRIGLIGPNGAGKSTLLKVLAGEEDPDAGEVSMRKRARIAVAPAELPVGVVTSALGAPFFIQLLRRRVAGRGT